MESLIQSGSAELCGLMNHDLSCMVMVQRGVFEDLVRNSTLNATLLPLNMEVEVMVWRAFSAAGTGELLHCEKPVNALEHRTIVQKDLPPLKRNDHILLCNTTMVLLTLQRPPRSGLRTSPSG